METYISFLHGINVSGKNLIRMADLRSSLSKLKLSNIKTYIQSGNIIFNFQDSKQSELDEMIQEFIDIEYGIFVPVFTLSTNELKNVNANNPYLKDDNIDTKKLGVTFLSKSPDQQLINKTKGILDPDDKFLIYGKLIYLYFPNGFARTRYTNNFFEKQLRVSCTTRNLNTINNILELCKD